MSGPAERPGAAALARAEMIEEAVSLLKRLGHPTRLLIVCRLVEGEMSVAEMEDELGLRQPSLSQQLGELRNAGIIEPRREAKNVVYRLADPKAERLVATLHALFCPAGIEAPALATRPSRPLPLGPFLGAAVFAKVGLLAAANDDPHTPAVR
ncbi:ArsR/SmtB family transcription factor [Jiella avicenniae]|uniref:Metalloregulator ArsR/SmtB family transcription factor n=1 Tax=Jiella avicenniae TaxID=2907202 RepID=A0A9X1P5G8_9HYPH|nr:metalloregulator ArsR/SmtB family transcription factor [Jiella avicenniae]MCE7030184.1 metalloregulator ArsR/SmtB family transcription factor [Jiella avicenniae]